MNKALLFCISTLLPALVSAAASAQNILVEHVTLVSPHLDELQKNQYVLIENGRIEQISATAISADKMAIRINGRGKYLTPGLMDSHAHVTIIPGIGFTTSKRAKNSPKLVDTYLKQQPRSFLYHGVTQVLDPSPLKGILKFTEAPVHPDLFKCGQIPNIGGYPEVEPEDAFTTSPFFILEGETPIPLPDTINPAEHTPEAVVERIAASGAICVKIFIEDGFGDATQWPILKDETVSRIRAAARAKGLPILAHANAIDMYQVALRNQVDVLAHGLWNWQWPEEKGPPPLEKTLTDVFETKTGYMPTIRVMAGLAGMFNPALLEEAAIKKVTPSALLAWYHAPDAQWFKAELREGFPADMPDSEINTIFNYGVSRDMRATKHLSDMGHPMLLASDFPASPTYVNQPGLTTFQEIQMLAEAGISLKKILAAATINNATQFGMEADYGTVEVGKIANLLLLRQNPLETVAAWDSIDTVFLHGKAINRETLQAQ